MDSKNLRDEPIRVRIVPNKVPKYSEFKKAFDWEVLINTNLCIVGLTIMYTRVKRNVLIKLLFFTKHFFEDHYAIIQTLITFKAIKTEEGKVELHFIGEDYNSGYIYFWKSDLGSVLNFENVFDMEFMEVKKRAYTLDNQKVITKIEYFTNSKYSLPYHLGSRITEHIKPYLRKIMVREDLIHFRTRSSRFVKLDGIPSNTEDTSLYNVYSLNSIKVILKKITDNALLKIKDYIAGNPSHDYSYSEIGSETEFSLSPDTKIDFIPKVSRVCGEVDYLTDESDEESDYEPYYNIDDNIEVLKCTIVNGNYKK
ncbi:hypothetical protein [Carp edema virus]|nr:hypothetical protein [Carp edema virus]